MGSGDPKRVVLDGFTITVNPTPYGLTLAQGSQIVDVAEELVEAAFQRYDWGESRTFEYMSFTDLESVSWHNQAYSIVRVKGGIVSFEGSSESSPTHVEIQAMIQEQLDSSKRSENGLAQALQATQDFSYVTETIYDVLWEPTPAPSATPAPTVSPTAAQTTVAPTVSPTAVQTTRTATVSPTAAQTTIAPTVSPTVAQTTIAPTVSPTVVETTRAPTTSPTAVQTTFAPITASPTAMQTTIAPTTSPTTVQTTLAPTVPPTVSPTSGPTVSTTAPTSGPTVSTTAPTSGPTVSMASSSSGPTILTAAPPSGSPLSTPSPTSGPTFPIVGASANASSNNSGSDSTLPMVVGIVAGLAPVAILAIILFVYQRKRKGRTVWHETANHLHPQDDDLEQGFTTKNEGMSEAGSSRLGRLLTAAVGGTAAACIPNNLTDGDTATPLQSSSEESDDDFSSFDGEGVSVEPIIIPIVTDDYGDDTKDTNNDADLEYGIAEFLAMQPAAIVQETKVAKENVVVEEGILFVESGVEVIGDQVCMESAAASAETSGSEEVLVAKNCDGLTKRRDVVPSFPGEQGDQSEMEDVQIETEAHFADFCDVPLVDDDVASTNKAPDVEASMDVPMQLETEPRSIIPTPLPPCDVKNKEDNDGTEEMEEQALAERHSDLIAIVATGSETDQEVVDEAAVDMDESTDQGTDITILREASTECDAEPETEPTKKEPSLKSMLNELESILSELAEDSETDQEDVDETVEMDGSTDQGTDSTMLHEAYSECDTEMKKGPPLESILGELDAESESELTKEGAPLESILGKLDAESGSEATKEGVPLESILGELGAEPESEPTKKEQTMEYTLNELDAESGSEPTKKEQTFQSILNDLDAESESESEREPTKNEPFLKSIQNELDAESESGSEPAKKEPSLESILNEVDTESGSERTKDPSLEPILDELVEDIQVQVGTEQDLDAGFVADLITNLEAEEDVAREEVENEVMESEPFEPQAPTQDRAFLLEPSPEPKPQLDSSFARWSDVSSDHSLELSLSDDDQQEFKLDESWDFNDNDEEESEIFDDPFQTPSTLPSDDMRPLLRHSLSFCNAKQVTTDETVESDLCSPTIEDGESDAISNDPFQTSNTTATNDEEPLLSELHGTYKLDKVTISDSEKRRRSRSAPPTTKRRTAPLH